MKHKGKHLIQSSKHIQDLTNGSKLRPPPFCLNGVKTIHLPVQNSNGRRRPFKFWTSNWAQFDRLDKYVLRNWNGQIIQLAELKKYWYSNVRYSDPRYYFKWVGYVDDQLPVHDLNNSYPEYLTYFSAFRCYLNIGHIWIPNKIIVLWFRSTYFSFHMITIRGANLGPQIYQSSANKINRTHENCLM
jgi:hypothetical protein